MKFDLLIEDDDTVARAASPRTRLPSVQCLCGRFAKNLGTVNYYNGTWDCARTTVECSRCGTVDIEHV